MEVCVDSVESALNAASGGASRLELCSSLSEGGLTPTPGLLKVIKSVVFIPVFVMLRPRGGGDFIFSSLEIEVMEHDARTLKQAGADGFVLGVLTKDGRVDESVCARLLKTTSPLPVTFHRAFDITVDPFEALETIICLGFSRILTSGQQTTAEKGMELISKLVTKAGRRIVIMPGAGITKSNLESILKTTRAKEFHASAKFAKELTLPRANNNCTMGATDDSRIFVADADAVRDMVNIFKSLSG